MHPISLKLYPDPVLRSICEPVTEFDSTLQDLIDEMKALMTLHQGIGLAAPQVGVQKRLFLAQQVSGVVTIINPIYLYCSQQLDYMQEGCLSLPQYEVNLPRKLQVHFSGYDAQGNKMAWRMFGLEARVVQHEIDHLNGRLICDYSTSQQKPTGIEIG